MTNLEPEAYSEHCQTSMMERFPKITPKIKKLLYIFIFQEMKFSWSNIKKFLIFQKTETPKKLFIFQEMELSYISGKVYLEPWHNGTFLYFRKGIFRTLA